MLFEVFDCALNFRVLGTRVNVLVKQAVSNYIWFMVEDCCRRYQIQAKARILFDSFR